MQRFSFNVILVCGWKERKWAWLLCFCAMALIIAQLNAWYIADEEEFKCVSGGNGDSGWDGWPECLISVSMAMIRIWPVMSPLHHVAIVTRLSFPHDILLTMPWSFDPWRLISAENVKLLFWVFDWYASVFPALIIGLDVPSQSEGTSKLVK